MWTNVNIPDDLLARAQTGDEQALVELWELCTPVVEASLRRGRVGRADADDLAQEAAFHFLNHVRSSNGGGTSFAESLAPLLRWRYHNLPRRERRGGAREHAADLASLESILARRTAGASEDGPAGVAVRNALNRLSPRQRAVIVGIYYHDQTVATLAREHGVSAQAITGLHRRALAVLRKILDETSEGIEG